MPVGIIAWLSALAVQFFTSGVVRWLATKGLIFTLTTVILPIVLNNVFYHFLQQALDLVTAQSSGYQSPTVALVGVGAWVAIKTRLPECLSLILSAVAKRFAFSLIPFVRIGK